MKTIQSQINTFDETKYANYDCICGFHLRYLQPDFNVVEYFRWQRAEMASDNGQECGFFYLRLCNDEKSDNSNKGKHNRTM